LDADEHVIATLSRENNHPFAVFGWCRAPGQQFIESKVRLDEDHLVEVLPGGRVHYRYTQRVHDPQKP
jgi:hypothetical protein